VDSDPTLEQLLQGSPCDILLNLREINDVCGSLIDKLHGIESQLFVDKGESSNTTSTSPSYNKWVRLSALYQLLFRSVAAHGASEDDIIMLALGIQMRRSTEFLKATQGLAETEDHEDTDIPEPPSPKSRSRSKKVH